MIVVAIIGILAAIALPAYQVFVARAQLSEVLVGLGEAKNRMMEFYTVNGRMPNQNESIKRFGWYSGWNDLRVQSGANDPSFVKGYNCWGANGGPCTTIEAWVNTKKLATVLQGEANKMGDYNRILLMIATVAPNGNVSWKCQPHPFWGLGNKYLPSSCRS